MQRGELWLARADGVHGACQRDLTACWRRRGPPGVTYACLRGHGEAGEWLGGGVLARGAVVAAFAVDGHARPWNRTGMGVQRF